MKENRNILIIANDRDTRDLLFKCIAPLFEECECIEYGFIKDIRAKNKHIKISTPQLLIRGREKQDIIILDSEIEYEREYLIDECYTVTNNVISIDFSSIKEKRKEANDLIKEKFPLLHLI